MKTDYMLPNPVSSDEDYKTACYFHDKLTELYSHWKIKFHLPTFELKQYTHILQNGWNIYYQFGKDLDGQYMEIYSTHRMTSDGHVKYYADGSKLILPSFTTSCPLGKEEEFKLWNERVAKDVYDPVQGILRGI